MSQASSDLVSFYLNGRSRIVRIECLQISHPSFSQNYYIVRNATDGIVVTHENGMVHTYTYYPCRIVSKGISADLDSGIRVDWGDLGSIIPGEIERVLKDKKIGIKPIVTYRVYRHDMLTAPMDGPYTLEIKTLSRNNTGCSFDAQAASLNINTTGELFDLTRFDALRDFLY